MDGITFQIGWEYFLGIISALIAGAWYANRRLIALEMSIDRIKNMVLELKKALDDANAKASGEAARDKAEAREPLKQQTLW
ncbi:hypothetical protein CV770_18650 [Bradyrhizobium sp. AC87j1]|nr:hypothetical protein CV770_18650 [Bradyrhizobium sp. AC87j1]